MDQPERKVIRLQEYDYSSNGVYFTTICTFHHQKLFWDGETAVLNECGSMAYRWLKKLPDKFRGLYLDCYAIMPNHVHLLLYFRDAETGLEQVLDWFKTMTTNEYIRMVKKGTVPPFEKKVWQRLYFEHVIRNETDLRETRRYIQENPLKWQLDKLYLP